MRNLRWSALACAALALACNSSVTSRKLVILHTNDEHSHLLGLGPEAEDFPPPTAAGTGSIKGGASRRSVKLAAERTRANGEGAATLTVSAGDNTIGTMVQVAGINAAPDYRVMKMLGYDVTTLGNHEFDFGPTALAAEIGTAVASTQGMVPVVATNIHFSGTWGDSLLAGLFDETGTDATKPIHRSLVVTASNGLKVGFVGILGAAAASEAPLKAPVRFSLASCCDENNTPAVLTQIFQDLRPVVDHLRRDEKVDLVVALSHSGQNPALPASGEDYQIAQNVAGIDVIVSGHTHTPTPAYKVTNLINGQTVVVQEAGRFGDNVGRIELAVDSNGKVTFDMSSSTLLPIDDTIIPSDLTINTFIGGVLQALETVQLPVVHKSFLEYTLSEALHADIVNNPATVGSLAFKTVGKTVFDVDNNAIHRETNLLVLAADAQLAAADAIAPTDVAFEAWGAIRIPTLYKGKTGNISFDDLFDAVALGASPVTSTPGYPLTRIGLYLVEIKAICELTAGYSYTSFPNADYFVVPAGMRCEFDTGRKQFTTSASALDPTNGRVTKITRASSHAGGVYDNNDLVLFDVSTIGVTTPDGWVVPPLTRYSAAANLYLATFASIAGVQLKDASTGLPLAHVTDAIMHRADGSEIKEWEALTAYVSAQSTANDGLPTRYDVTTSAGQIRRAVCSGPLCVN